MERGEWAQWLTYVQENAGKLSVKEMTKHIGCGERSLCKRAKRWRTEGHIIKDLDIRRHIEVGTEKIVKCPTGEYKYIWDGSKWKGAGRADGQILKKGPKGPIGPRKPLGNIIEKNIGGITYLYQRIGYRKYKSLGRKDGKKVRKGPEPKPKEPKVKKVKVPKPVPVKQPKVVSRRKEKNPELLVFKTRVVDPSTLKSVRVDSKTMIQVSVDIPDEVAIRNWEEKRKQQERISYKPSTNRKYG